MSQEENLKDDSMNKLRDRLEMERSVANSENVEEIAWAVKEKAANEVLYL